MIHLNTIVITIISVSDLLDVWSQTPFHSITTPQKWIHLKLEIKAAGLQNGHFDMGINYLVCLPVCMRELLKCNRAPKKPP